MLFQCSDTCHTHLTGGLSSGGKLDWHQGNWYRTCEIFEAFDLELNFVLDAKFTAEFLYHKLIANTKFHRAERRNLKIFRKHFRTSSVFVQNENQLLL